MDFEAKIRYFQKQLLKWYAVNGRSFPWRLDGLSAYEYIISEVLLQRTRAQTIKTFYPKFITTYSNWDILNSASKEELLIFLKPVGLSNQRATRLKMLASEMVKRDGKLPFERKELEQIPYFGQYIVNAIYQLIHKRAEPLLDVNMARVIERIFEKRKLSDIRSDPKLQMIAKKIVAHKKSKEINWAILDFASLICAYPPKCAKCFLISICNYDTNS